MPAAQLLSASIELAFNQLLALDPDSKFRLQKLKGKSLRVQIKELPWPLTFSFSHKVDLLIEDEATADCQIKLALSEFERLRDSSQLTSLIKQDKLELEGDIQVAQRFSQLVNELDIDWEEHLSKYTGDVIANQLFSFADQFKNKVTSHFQQFQHAVSEGGLHEKPIAVHPLALEDFSDQVNALRADAERFEARLTAFAKEAVNPSKEK